MHRERIPKVDVNELPPDRQKAVARTKGRLRRGEYITSSRLVDDKTVDGVLEEVLKDVLKDVT